MNKKQVVISLVILSLTASVEGYILAKGNLIEILSGAVWASAVLFYIITVKVVNKYFNFTPKSKTVKEQLQEIEKLSERERSRKMDSIKILISFADYTDSSLSTMGKALKYVNPTMKFELCRRMDNFYGRILYSDLLEEIRESKSVENWYKDCKSNPKFTNKLLEFKNQRTLVYFQGFFDNEFRKEKQSEFKERAIEIFLTHDTPFEDKIRIYDLGYKFLKDERDKILPVMIEMASNQHPKELLIVLEKKQDKVKAIISTVLQQKMVTGDIGWLIAFIVPENENHSELSREIVELTIRKRRTDKLTNKGFLSLILEQEEKFFLGSSVRKIYTEILESVLIPILEKSQKKNYLKQISEQTRNKKLKELSEKRLEILCKK